MSNAIKRYWMNCQWMSDITRIRTSKTFTFHLTVEHLKMRGDAPDHVTLYLREESDENGTVRFGQPDHPLGHDLMLDKPKEACGYLCDFVSSIVSSSEDDVLSRKWAKFLKRNWPIECQLGLDDPPA